MHREEMEYDIVVVGGGRGAMGAERWPTRDSVPLGFWGVLKFEKFWGFGGSGAPKGGFRARAPSARSILRLLRLLRKYGRNMVIFASRARIIAESRPEQVRSANWCPWWELYVSGVSGGFGTAGEVVEVEIARARWVSGRSAGRFWAF